MRRAENKGLNPKWGRINKLKGIADTEVIEIEGVRAISTVYQLCVSWC